VRPKKGQIQERASKKRGGGGKKKGALTGEFLKVFLGCPKYTWREIKQARGGEEGDFTEMKGLHTKSWGRAYLRGNERRGTEK